MDVWRQNQKIPTANTHPWISSSNTSQQITQVSNSAVEPRSPNHRLQLPFCYETPWKPPQLGRRASWQWVDVCVCVSVFVRFAGMKPTCHAWRGFQEFPIEILNHHVALLRRLHPEEREGSKSANWGDWSNVKILSSKRCLNMSFLCLCLPIHIWSKMTRTGVCVLCVLCVLCVCAFSMGFPLLCPALKAPFSMICCVSCPLCLPLFSCAHPITAQWLIACLASKSQLAWGRKKCWRGDSRRWCVCVCVRACTLLLSVLGFLHITVDPEGAPPAF